MSLYPHITESCDYFGDKQVYCIIKKKILLSRLGRRAFFQNAEHSCWSNNHSISLKHLGGGGGVHSTGVTSEKKKKKNVFF